MGTSILKNLPVKTPPEGMKFDLNFTIRLEVCPTCEGRGRYLFSSSHYDTEENCSRCQGQGYCPDEVSARFLQHLKKLLNLK